MILTFGLSAACYVGMAMSEVFRQTAIIPMMWAPGIAALIAQRVSGGRLRDLGFGWGQTRWQALAVALPISVPAVVYPAVWLTGLGAMDATRATDLAARLFGAESGSPLASFVTWAVFMATFGVAASVVCALGEEIGWRGLLVPELASRMSFTRVGLISGFIWAVWHYPFILFFGYHQGAPLWFSLLTATVGMVAASVLLAWLRLRSGSLWTAALFHGIHNLVVQEAFDLVTVDTGPTELIVGEFGFALPLVYVGIAVLFWCKRDALRSGDA